MATKDYEDLSEQLRQTALEAAAGNNGQQAPAYAGTYEDQLSSIFDKIQNREPFKYDMNADPLYQQYKDQYVQGGKLAMKDTMGQAAALTGGYGSSYGQQVGQQAYNAYLQDLSKAIPELYGMAYNMYQDKGNELNQQYSMLGQLRDTEYGRYRDELSDYNYNQNLARQLEEQEYNRRMEEDNNAYARQQTSFSNLVALIKASGYSPTDEELAAAGLTREAANALIMNYMLSSGLLSSGGGGGSGGGSGGGGGSRSAASGSGAEDIMKNYSWTAMMDAVRNGASFADISHAIMSETGLSAEQQRMLQQRASDVVTGNTPSAQAEAGRNAAIAAAQAYNAAQQAEANRKAAEANRKAAVAAEAAKATKTPQEKKKTTSGGSGTKTSNSLR